MITGWVGGIVGGCGCWCGRLVEQQHQADTGSEVALSRVPQAEVAHFVKALWQHMLEEAAGELEAESSQLAERGDPNNPRSARASEIGAPQSAGCTVRSLIEMAPQADADSEC